MRGSTLGRAHTRNSAKQKKICVVANCSNVYMLQNKPDYFRQMVRVLFIY